MTDQKPQDIQPEKGGVKSGYLNKEVTHSVSTPNAKPAAPATPIEKLKKVLAADYMTQVTNYYGGNKEEALRFMTSAIEYVRRTPKLLDCAPISLLTSLVQVAQFRFMPSGVSGEAYIIPYKDEAKFQLGYQGIVTLLYRTDKISTITANIIHKNDEFEYQEGLQANLIHKPAMFGKDRGDAIGVYTVVQMSDGAKTFHVMDQQAVMKIKNLSKAKGSESSPWNSDKDPFFWMWKKTCLIQHAKLLPKTQDLQHAIEEDYKGGGIEKPHFDAAGPAVGRAFHTPDNSPDEEGAQA